MPQSGAFTSSPRCMSLRGCSVLLQRCSTYSAAEDGSSRNFRRAHSVATSTVAVGEKRWRFRLAPETHLDAHLPAAVVVHVPMAVYLQHLQRQVEIRGTMRVLAILDRIRAGSPPGPLAASAETISSSTGAKAQRFAKTRGSQNETFVSCNGVLSRQQYSAPQPFPPHGSVDMGQ